MVCFDLEPSGTQSDFNFDWRPFWSQDLGLVRYLF